MSTFNTNARTIPSKLNYFPMLSCLIFALLISYAYCVDRQQYLSRETFLNWGRIPTNNVITTTTTTAKPKIKRPTPPLIHPNDEDYAGNKQQFESAAKPSHQRMTTIRPRRTTNQPRTMFRPTTTFRSTTRTTTQAPIQAPPSAESLSRSWTQLEKTLKPTPVGIDPCIWAAISCCESHEQIQYTCFQYLGCAGDFGDRNSCSPEFLRDAMETAANYLNS